jgi:lipid II:glycine glycyltransferase (peptidoglycan interpeptide bridge formation enzyme)
MIEVNSSLPYNALYEIGIRQAGYLKPAGLFSTPLTILIDLTKPVEYDKNWQKNLRRAEKYQLNFVPAITPTEKDIKDYMLIHSEMTGRKDFNDGLSFQKLKTLLRDSNFMLFFVEAGSERIAGIITYTIKKTATSIFSAASPKARQMSAAYFRDNNLYEYYRRQGYLSFDRGRLSPAAHKKNDIFMFKNGVKGSYLLYCGEWSRYKRQIYRPLMYFVKKYLFKRVEV